MHNIVNFKIGKLKCQASVDYTLEGDCVDDFDVRWFSVNRPRYGWVELNIDMLTRNLGRVMDALLNAI